MLDKLLVITLNDDVIHGGTEGSIKGGERMEVGHRVRPPSIRLLHV